MASGIAFSISAAISASSFERGAGTVAVAVIGAEIDASSVAQALAAGLFPIAGANITFTVGPIGVIAIASQTLIAQG